MTSDEQRTRIEELTRRLRDWSPPADTVGAPFHVRRRPRRRGGNQFYRDRAERVATTYCGAEPTDRDVGWRDRAEPFDGHAPCEECLRIRDEENRNQRRKR